MRVWVHACALCVCVCVCVLKSVTAEEDPIVD